MTHIRTCVRRLEPISKLKNDTLRDIRYATFGTLIAIFPRIWQFVHGPCS